MTDDVDVMVSALSLAAEHLNVRIVGTCPLPLTLFPSFFYHLQHRVDHINGNLILNLTHGWGGSDRGLPVSQCVKALNEPVRTLALGG